METLNFDKLVRSYYENLNTKLRNFYTGPDFLDSWVHDENLNRSLFGVFESANDNGVSELSVEVSEALSKEVDFPQLTEDLNQLGSSLLEKTAGGYRVSLRKIHPSYEKALRQREIRFEGTVLGGLFSKEGQLELSGLVDSTGIIKEAKHRGGIGFFRPLLDTLCEILIGRTLQEGHEHALIRLESVLRDPDLPPPVKGLVTPKNGDPAFRVLEALVRKLGEPYEGRNEWVDTLSPEWKALPLTEQKRQVESMLSGTDLKVLEIRGNNRVVLNGDTFRVSPNAGHELMRLEKRVKDSLEPTLEFVLESLEDKNKRELR